MASYDRLIKYLVENVQAALAPLGNIVKNQEIIIVQNKQMITLLEQVRNNSLIASDPEEPLNLMRTSADEE